MKHRNIRGLAIVSGLTEKATTPTHPGAMTPAQLVTRAAEHMAVALASATITAAVIFAMLAAVVIFN